MSRLHLSGAVALVVGFGACAVAEPGEIAGTPPAHAPPGSTDTGMAVVPTDTGTPPEAPEVADPRCEPLYADCEASIHTWSWTGIAFEAVGGGQRSHDSCGHVTQDAIDHDLDGSIDTLETWTYDEEFRPVSVQRDEGGDGTIEARTVHAYNDLGDPEWTGIDHNADGSFDETIVRTFDAAGQLLSQETVAGWVVHAERFTYDATGRLAVYTLDEWDNGQLDRLELTTYAVDGWTVRGDDDLDGLWNDVTTVTTDPNGWVVSEAIDEEDDGVVEVLTTWVYSEEGRELSRETDDNGDGQATRRTTTIWACP